MIKKIFHKINLIKIHIINHLQSIEVVYFVGPVFSTPGGGGGGGLEKVNMRRMRRMRIKKEVEEKDMIYISLFG